MHEARGMVSFHRVLELIARFDLQRLANLPWNCCLYFSGERGMGPESLLTSYLSLPSLLCLTWPLAGKESRGIFTRYHLSFPKTAAKMAALRNDFLHSIARLSASSGDPGSDLLRHLSPCRFASQRTRPPASQGAGYHRESKPRREYQAGRSFSFARTSRLTEKGRAMSRLRDWLLSPPRLSRRRHCRRAPPLLSRPPLSPLRVGRDAQSCPCAIFPPPTAYPLCHSAFLEVLFRPQGKRAFRSHTPFFAARVFR